MPYSNGVLNQPVPYIVSSIQRNAAPLLRSTSRLNFPNSDVKARLRIPPLCQESTHCVLNSGRTPFMQMRCMTPSSKSPLNPHQKSRKWLLKCQNICSRMYPMSIYRLCWQFFCHRMLVVRAPMWFTCSVHAGPWQGMLQPTQQHAYNTYGSTASYITMRNANACRSTNINPRQERWNNGKNVASTISTQVEMICHGILSFRFWKGSENFYKCGTEMFRTLLRTL